MTVSKRLRFEVLTRDSHRCTYCGRAAPEVKLTIDHVLPTALGGVDDSSNLVTACADCNAGKSSMQPAKDQVMAVAEDALRWSRAIRMVAEKHRANRVKTSEDIEVVEAEWNNWTYDVAETVYVKKPVPRDADWRESIERVMAMGLAREDLVEYIRITMANKSVVVHNSWRYFMGCCWNRVRDIQAEAAALLNEGHTEGTATEVTARELLDQLP